MTSPEAPFPLAQGKGAAYIHTTIIASLCTDAGVQIACHKCGHVFVQSRPLSDESEPVDNIALARAIWYHRCDDEGRRYREAEFRARRTKRR
jgi:hypothetical protein